MDANKQPKLWILQRKGVTDYDKHRGMVVRAFNPRQARKMAVQASNRDDAVDFEESELVSCVELRNTGPLGVVIKDFKAG